ncbi:MAG: PilZ domain-containing protein [Treponema sp.]|nr:PilZ domain-containing protein [Treponema sp.]
METLIALLIAAVIILAMVKIYMIYRKKIGFFTEGLSQGFSFVDIGTLWKTSRLCDLEEPVSLFYSMPSLTKCISHIKSQAESDGTANSAKSQNLLSKLYTFRTKIEKDADKKRGLESTRALSNGQKLRIILPGKGVFYSEIVNNAREIAIKVPTQKGQITIDGADWVGKSISVYLWRTGDARYVFDTTVDGVGLFLGKSTLYLHHSTDLIRTQKRNAVRAKCHIFGDLYIIKEKIIDYNVIETRPGYKCLLEDISETGALIRIGGKGVPNVQIRLQFQLQDRLVVMFGVIRNVEFNEKNNESKLHFECVHIEPVMKNHVLSYVYNILPENEKEIYDALSLTDDDENAEKALTGSNNETSKSLEEGFTEPIVPQFGDMSGKLDKSILDTDDIIKANEKVDSDESVREEPIPDMF